MRFSGVGRAFGVVAALALASGKASALPADAACVYLAIGCYAPSPVPAPAFPDPLFAPIPVPPFFAPISIAVPVPAPAVEAAPPGLPHRHRRKPRIARQPD